MGIPSRGHLGTISEVHVIAFKKGYNIFQLSKILSYFRRGSVILGQSCYGLYTVLS